MLYFSDKHLLLQEDTISINHNWLNGCNIDICWKHLQAGLLDVKKEIEHCSDMDGWNEQCQVFNPYHAELLKWKNSLSIFGNIHYHF